MMESSDFELETTNCPLCDCAEWRCVIQAPDVLYRIPGTFQTVRCKNCKHVYLNPQPTVADILKCYPDDYGPHQFRESSNQPAELQLDQTGQEQPVEKSPWYLSGWARAIPGLRWLYYWLVEDYSNIIPDEVAVPKTALDVGCSSGSFLLKLRDKGWIASGVEIAEVPAKKAQALGFPVHLGTLESAEYDSESFDAAFAYVVLEVVHDPKGMLVEINRVLKDDGWLVLSVPNFACWERFVFRKYWRALELPRQLQHFTPRILKKLLAETGFGNVQIVHQRNSSNLTASVGLWLRDIIPKWGLGQSLISLADSPTLFSKVMMAPVAKFMAMIRQGGRLTIVARKTSGRPE